MRLTLCALISFLCSFCFPPQWNGDILVVFRSVDRSDCMTNQQMDNSWKRGSGPSGVTTFLCKVWESLLTSIYLWFLIWEPWQQNNTNPREAEHVMELQQNRRFFFFFFPPASPVRQTEADWERCFSYFTVYIDHLGSVHCGIPFHRSGMGPEIMHFCQAPG